MDAGAVKQRVTVVIYRSHDGEPIGLPCQIRKQFANLDPRHICGNRLEQAPGAAGASGFKSNVSCCGGPPSMYRRMQAFAVAGRAAAAVAGAADARPARICGNVNPIADNPPACKNVRRAIGVEAFHRDRIICRFRKSPNSSEHYKPVRWAKIFSPTPDFTQRPSSTLVMLPSMIRWSQRAEG
jgi:hypothetical protein